MAVRIISALVALPLLLIVVIIGGNVLKIGTLLISLIGMYELYRALSKKVLPIHFFGFACATIYILGFTVITPTQLPVLLSLFILLIFIFMVLFHEKTTIVDAIVTLFGFFYVPFLLYNIYQIREMDNGKGIFFVWSIFISAWACDTGAYFTGITIGKHKLIPTLSPKKTIEGSVGGVLSATVFAFLYGLVINMFFHINIMVEVSVICFFASILSQFGDLTASAIKRYTKIKDFGKIMPGHGGVLDRFDSILFTAPTVFIVLSLLGIWR